MVPRQGLALSRPPAEPAAGFRPVELLLLGYLALTTVVAVLRLHTQPASSWVIAANLFYVLLIVMLPRVPLAGFGRLIREIYPLVLVTSLYSALDILNNFGAVRTYDELVRSWETWLFGGQISQEWWQRYPSQFWSTVLHGAYFAYYPIVALPVLYFLFSGKYQAVQRSMLWLMATYLTCYAIYLVFPVAGPYYEFPRPSAVMLDNPMARLVYGTLSQGSAYGAAFPSSHVAATLVATAAAFAGDRRAGAMVLIPALLLCVGVVYCQMHYGVDALAGGAVAGLVVIAGIWFERRGLRESRKD